MKSSMFFLTIGILVFLTITRQPKIPANPSSIAEMEIYIEKSVAKNTPPGISIAVIKNEEIVYNQAFGYADRPMKILATTETVYHWWSMTKIPTAIAILQLYDSGKLNIDDFVSEYLPFFQVTLDGKPVPSITIRQLLRHTSGLADTMPAMTGWVHYDNVTYNQTKLLEQYLPQYSELKFAPDSQFAYSNFGYMVLGTIIEKVSGVSYEKYIQENILNPLDMRNTGFLYTPKMEGKIAAGSHPLFSIYTPLLPFLLNTNSLIREREGIQYWFNPVYLDVTPSSGLLGSAEDSALLAKALLTKTNLLSPESRMLLLPKGENPTERPLGWAEYNMTGRLWLQHRGGGPGFATIMRLYPEENLGIFIMANNTDLPREKLVDAFANLDW